MMATRDGIPVLALASALLLLGCRDHRESGGWLSGLAAAPTASCADAPTGALVPMPGADLDGPVPLPPPARVRSAGAAAAEPLDLASDRPAMPVAVPEPPRGGAVEFGFADAQSGWVARIPEGVQLPAVAYGDGRVYVSGGFESVNFYALDAASGRFEWATRNLEDNGPTAAIYDRGRVIFNTESCTLFALDAVTGKRLWFKFLGDPTLAQTAVSGDLIYASHPGPGGQWLSAYRVRDGFRKWTRRVDGELLAAPVVAGDSVYASTVKGTLYRFDRATGDRFWRSELEVTTAPWAVGDELFVSRRHQHAEQQVVVAAATGEIVREHHAKQGGYLSDVPGDLDDWKRVWAFEGSRPVVDRGVRYVAMGGEIRASDATTGEPLWVRRYAKAADRRSVGTVALAGPQVVISTRDGQVYGLDIDTGYTLWGYDVGHPVVAEPIVASGWVYLATTDGYVIGLRVGDSSLDGWHMFGGNPEHNGQVG